MIPNPFERKVIEQCNRCNMQELKEYISDIQKQLCKLEVGTIEHSVVLTNLIVAMEVYDTRNRRTR